MPTDTAAVLEHVTDDIEYWDVTLDEPLRGREAYARYVDGFFAAFSEIETSPRTCASWGCGRRSGRGPSGP